MSELPPRPNSVSVLNALGPSPSAPPHESNVSNLSYIDAAATASPCSLWLFKEERGCYLCSVFCFAYPGTRTSGQGVLTTTPLDLGQNHEGYDIVHFPSSSWLFMGFIDTAKTKFCTWVTCNVDNHWL
eukprot:6682697-Ditylum_brightwellii.AAC.1